MGRSEGQVQEHASEGPGMDLPEIWACKGKTEGLLTEKIRFRPSCHSWEMGQAGILGGWIRVLLLL